MLPRLVGWLVVWTATAYAAADDDPAPPIEVQPASRATPGSPMRPSGEESLASLWDALLPPAVSSPRPIFSDSFRSDELDRTKWELARGVELGEHWAGDGSRVRELRLAGRAGDAELRSVPLDVSELTVASVTYSARPENDAPAGELVVEYWNGAQWENLDKLRADLAHAKPAVRRTVRLPLAAYHDGFQLRFRTPRRSPGAWCLQHVAVIESPSGPAATLAADLWPARDAQVHIAVGNERPAFPAEAPYRRTFAAGTRLMLLAPAEAGGWGFSHWTVDGVAQPAQQRVLTLELAGNLDAIAYYSPFAPRAAARVEIDSAPLRVPLDLRLLPGMLLGEAAVAQRFLPGERIRLTAPAQTPRAVFRAWRVNGQPEAEGQTTLLHRVSGDARLTAEYDLLGDMNGDGRLDKLDVDSFMLALVDPQAYGEGHPGLNRVRLGDINGDGAFDEQDIDPFADLVLGE